MPTLPVLTGRVEELDAVEEAWARTVADRSRGPQVVLLTGDAGSGKSRLVAEVLRRLRPTPGVILSGGARAFDPAPYDWLASALVGQPIGHLPVPADVLGWLTQRDGERAQRRLSPSAVLRAADGVVRGLVGEGPGVLVVEDLHDLDPASLTLVAELAGGPPLPCLLLVTSRAPHEAAFPPAATRTLRRLTGSPWLVRRHLGALTLPETAELVEGLLGVAPPPEIVRSLQARTDGNPYWLCELVAAHRAAGVQALAEAPLPAHLAAQVADRLDGEPGFVGDVARAAALLGDVVQPEALSAVCGDEVEAALRRLVDLGILVVDPDGPLRFRYPLAAEALAASALPAQRRHVHERALLAAVERDDAVAVARHARALGRRDVAAEAAVRVAADLLATGRAEDALDMVDIGAQEPALLRVGATAAIVAGRFPTAMRYAQRWLDRLPPDASEAELAEVHRHCADAAWHAGNVAEHLTYLALAGDAAAEAESLLRLGRPAAAVEAADAALKDMPEHPGATVTLGAALVASGNPVRGAAQLRLGRQRAEDQRDPLAFGRAVEQLAALGGWSAYEEAMATLIRHRLEFRVGVTVWHGVELAVREGDLGRAEALLAARMAVEPDQPQRAVLLAAAGLLAVERGADGDADRLLARAEATLTGIDRPDAIHQVELLRLALVARRGGGQQSWQAFTVYLGRVPFEDRPGWLADATRWALRGGARAARVREAVPLELFAALPRTGAQLACLLGAAAGDDDEALAQGLAGLEVDQGSATRRKVGKRWRGTGELRVEERLPAWQDAEIHATLARTLVRLGKPEKAREHAEAAVALLRRWSGWRQAEADGLVASVRSGGDLTARELQVLECLAAGMSNQQVARSLGISIRTVTVHVSNLLRKTGAASRTEAALWAVRHRVVSAR
jgi:DNA-binding CsgD family transcriptional regulator